MQLGSVVALERTSPLWMERWNAAAASRSQRVICDGGERCTSPRTNLWRGSLFKTAVHSTLSLPERADRRRYDSELADVGDSPGPVPQRHRSERTHQQSWTKQRRLQSRVVHGRAD